MRVDVSKSIYHERADAPEAFNSQELRHLRLILRRLHFLEAQVRANGGLRAKGASGGAAFAEWEVAALAWILDDVEFLETREEVKQ